MIPPVWLNSHFLLLLWCGIQMSQSGIPVFVFVLFFSSQLGRRWSTLCLCARPQIHGQQTVAGRILRTCWGVMPPVSADARCVTVSCCTTAVKSALRWGTSTRQRGADVSLCCGCWGEIHCIELIHRGREGGRGGHLRWLSAHGYSKFFTA